MPADLLQLPLSHLLIHNGLATASQSMYHRVAYAAKQRSAVRGWFGEGGNKMCVSGSFRPRRDERSHETRARVAFRAREDRDCRTMIYVAVKSLRCRGFASLEHDALRNACECPWPRRHRAYRLRDRCRSLPGTVGLV